MVAEAGSCKKGLDPVLQHRTQDSHVRMIRTSLPFMMEERAFPTIQKRDSFDCSCSKENMHADKRYEKALPFCENACEGMRGIGSASGQSFSREGEGTVQKTTSSKHYQLSLFCRLKLTNRRNDCAFSLSARASANEVEASRSSARI